MIQICICDDNMILLQKYQSAIETLAKKSGVSVAVTAFPGGEQLISYIELGGTANIIYMDIIMTAGLNGIETAHALREIGYRGVLIFLTSSDEYIFESFDVNPLHYLSKMDTSDEKFEEVLLRALEAVAQEDDLSLSCLTPNGDAELKINPDDALYIEQSGSSSKIFCTEESYICPTSLEDLHDALKDRYFVLSGPTCLVNLKHVERIDKNRVILTGDISRPTGGAYGEPIKAALSRYLSSVF